MDAVEFFKERRRMCLNYDECKGCPCEKSDPVSCNPCTSEIEILVKIIEQWSKSHPQKTMIQDFFEKFPNAPKTENGTPRNICPSDCGYTNEPESYIICEHFTDDCLKCWSRPLEES